MTNENTKTEELLILPFYKQKIPYESVYDHNGKLFILGFFYNQQYDFFTADLYRLENGEKKAIAQGEKITLNQMLFELQAELNEDIPQIIPIALDESIAGITWNNMGKEVELVVLE